MAQQNTGLGWSAKSDYLINTSRSIGEFSTMGWNDDYPHQPLPVITDPNQVLQGGLHLRYNTNYGRQEDHYIASTRAEDIFVCSGGSGSNHSSVYISPTQGAQIIEVIWDRRTQSIVTNYNLSLDRDTATGGVTFYYNGESLYNQDIAEEYPNITTQTNVNTIAAEAAPILLANRTSQQIYKLNAGYAVCCFAKWYDLEGNEILSPVTISSDADYATLSLDGTAPATQGRTSELWQGMRFTMSYIPNLTGALLATVPVLDLRQFAASTPGKILKIIANESIANIIVTDAPDPYEQEGGSGEEDGGDGDEVTDDENGIEINSDYPSAINTGFCRIYCPSESELRSLSNYLWSNSYDLTQVKKLFSNPMDSVIGLSVVPIQLSGTSVNFSLGGIVVPDMTLPMVSQQRYTYYMGGITVKERWGSYLDYDPYTKFSIFLPFIGMRELSTDDIMGKQVMLYYDIDILSGTCTARLQAGKHCLYEWGGSCALQLPINSRNWDSVFNTAVGALGGIVSAVSGGGAPLIAGSVASAALQTVSMKPRVDKSSAVSGASGWLGQMTPYLIRTTPEAYIPNDQNKYIGYPSYLSVSLGSISGYNEIDSVHLENIPATGDELAELESILKGGVIF